MSRVVTLYGGPAAGQAYELETTPPDINVVIPDPINPADFREDVADVLAAPARYSVAVYRRSPWNATHYHYDRTVEPVTQPTERAAVLFEASEVARNIAEQCRRKADIRSGDDRKHWHAIAAGASRVALKLTELADGTVER